MSFFAELKRRNVIRVGIAYVVVAWLIMQFADVVLNNIAAPGWVFQAIMLVLAIGFPLVLLFAWAFEMTPEGLKKEKDVDRSQSIAPVTGKKLNNTILVLMALAIGYLLFDKFSERGSEPFSQESPVQLSEAGDEKKDPTPDGASEENSIAVLPFANRSNEEEDLFFTDGIHDDLLTQLAKINDLKVTSRTSVMEYRDTTKKIKEIAAELGVTKILEGGIQRAGKRIRVNAQLIDVATDEHLWAETFDREMTIENIFDIQSEITRQIVTAVKGELSDEESEALAIMPTDSLAAYEAYLHAKTFLNSPDYNEDKYKEAGVWVNKAIENDPEFALAWAMQVGIHGQAIWMGFDISPEKYQLARDALAKAAEYGPFLPETLAARGEFLYRVENRYHEAETAFRSAFKAKPGDVELLKLLALTLRRTGKWEEAVSKFQLAIELNPDDVEARTNLIEVLIHTGEYERAEPMVDLWIEKYPQAKDIKSYKTMILLYHHGDLAAARNWHDQLEVTNSGAYWANAVYIPVAERNYLEAIQTVDQSPWASLRLDPALAAWIPAFKSQAYGLSGDEAMAADFARQAIDTELNTETATDHGTANYLDALSLAYVEIGNTDKALQTIEEALNLVPESRDSLKGTQLSYSRAYVLAMAGRRDEALAEIDRLLKTPGGMDRWELYLNPQWDFFRDDERFSELIRPPNLEEAGK